MLIQKINKNFILITIIILLGLFLRIYNLENRLVFAWDQDRDANIIYDIVYNHKLPLIGPRIMNDNGFFLGPYFFYLLLPFYLISGMHPYANILFIAVLYIIFSVISYFIIKKIFSQKIAIIFIFLWSIFQLALDIDTISWNPIVVPLFMIISLYFLSLFSKQKNYYFILFGLFLGIAINFHVQLGIILFLFLSEIIFNKNIKNKIVKIFYLFIGVLISLLPLIIFDLRHSFINLNLILSFLNSNSLDKNYLAFYPVLKNFFISVFPYCSTILLPILLLIIQAFLIIFSKKYKVLKNFVPIFLYTLIIFALYAKRPSEYYFNYLLPIIILVFSIIINNFIHYLSFAKIIFPLLLLITFKHTIPRFHNTPFSLQNKIETVKYIKDKVNNNEFSLSYSVELGQNHGYSYLFKYYKVEPSTDFNKPLVQIEVPPSPFSKVFGGIGVKIPPVFLR